MFEFFGFNFIPTGLFYFIVAFLATPALVYIGLCLISSRFRRWARLDTPPVPLRQKNLIVTVQTKHGGKNSIEAELTSALTLDPRFGAVIGVSDNAINLIRSFEFETINCCASVAVVGTYYQHKETATLDLRLIELVDGEVLNAWSLSETLGESCEKELCHAAAEVVSNTICEQACVREREQEAKQQEFQRLTLLRRILAAPPACY